MLYMIGGPPRMGKSSLAQLITKEYRIPYVSTDGLTVMLKPVGQPSFYSREKADRFFPYLDLFIGRIQKTAPDYIIEGDAFTPEHVRILQEKYDIKPVFLVMKKVRPDLIIEHAQFDRWTDNISDGELKYLCERIALASKDIQKQCQQLDIGCFDMSRDYQEQFKRACNYLMK